MTEASQEWFAPVDRLDAFRDLKVRLEQPFGRFPYPEGRLHAVLGGAGMGKSSLLNVLPAWLTGVRERNGLLLVPAPVRLPEGLADTVSLRGFLIDLARQLREGLRSFGLCTITERSFDPYFDGGNLVEGFRDALRFLLDEALRVSLARTEDSNLHHIRLIGLLDDADAIANAPWASDFFEGLRRLYRDGSVVRARLDLVMAGENSLARFFEGTGTWALEDRWPLRPIRTDTVSDWLQEISGGQLSPEMTEAILDESGGQPFLIRYFVHHLREAQKRSGWARLDLRTIERLARNFDTRHPRIPGAWTRSMQQVRDRAVLKALCNLLLAAGSPGVDLYEIEEQLQAQEIRIDAERLLEQLVWQGIAHPVHDQPDHFALTGVFRRCLEQRKDQILPPQADARPQAERSAVSRREFEYNDLKLRLSREADGYHVRAISHWGAAGELSDSPIFLDEEQPRWQETIRQANASQEVVAFGARLFRALLPEEVRSRFRSAWDQAQSRRLGLRIKLLLQDHALHSVPWELVYDELHQSFLAARSDMALVRYIEGPTPIPDFSPLDRLHVLVVAASPTDQVPLQVDQELETLGQALEPGRRGGWLNYTVVRGGEANADHLMWLLRQENYHVFHFLGHGLSDKTAGEGVLLLENEDRTSQRLKAGQLQTLFQGLPELRLAFLNACETGIAPGSAPFTSVAEALIRAGIPAVVATQDQISDRAASRFSGAFYETLAEHHPVEAAMAEGRKAVILDPGNHEWVVPVLYLRAEHGLIFPPLVSTR